MRTNFSPQALSDPGLADVERTLRACVHCGICTATCPTYVLLGDERDSPRGRIVMIQDMLERGVVPSAETVRHVDRCLSCLACRSACPSGVDYRRLIDAGRAHIETRFRRPLGERMKRAFVARVLTRPRIVKVAVSLARALAPVATRLPGLVGRLARTAVRSAPRVPGLPQRRPMETGENHAREGGAGRIVLIAGCVQPSLAPQIDQAVARLLERRGIGLVHLKGAACCGALSHHLGRADQAKELAKQVIGSFERTSAQAPCDAILISATGCAAHLKDVGDLFAADPEWRERANAFASKLRDFSEIIAPLPAILPRHLRVAYQAPCSLQHGLRRMEQGAAQLQAAGFDVMEIPENHLCCGSAGSYSILQPDIAAALRTRKLAAIATTKPDVIASPNIGCLSHLAGPDAPPLAHPAELIDWAEGGPLPAALGGIA